MELTDNFVKNLYVENSNYYYGNIFLDYYNKTNDIGKETLICDEIEYNSKLFKFINKPSEAVILSAIKSDCTYFHSIENPTKKQIIQFIIANPAFIYKYYDGENKSISVLTDKDIKEIIENNPDIYFLIQKKCHNEKLLYKLAVSAVKSITKQMKNINLNDYILLKNIKDIRVNINRDDSYFTFFFKNIIYWKNESANLIVDSVKHCKYVYLLPIEYQTSSNIKKALFYYPETAVLYDINLLDVTDIEQAVQWDVTFIKNVPHNLQTKKVIDCILTSCSNTLLYHSYIQKYDFNYLFNPLYEKNDNLLLCFYGEMTNDQAMAFINMNINLFIYIPDSIKTIEMCIKAVNHNYMFLDYCPIINNDIIAVVDQSLKQNHTNMRRNRWNVIRTLKDTTIDKLVSIKPNLIGYLTKERQTVDLVKKAVCVDGYSLQYVINKTPEIINLAITQQPKAVKYVK